MIKLNLPSFDCDLKNENGKVLIFDSVRKKYVVLTPEEWVRQHFLNYLIQHMKYPKALTRVESGLTFNTLQKRSDIVVFDRKGIPWLVVECKSPQEKIDNRILKQVSTYNVSLTAPYVAVTNGLIHFVFKIDRAQKATTQLTDFPEYPTESKSD